MALTRNGYIPRLADKKLSSLLKTFGAVSIEGPKWCGKTWTGLHHANSVVYLMDPADNYANRARAMLDPSLVLRGKAPLLLDEWQEAPGLWDAVRFMADQEQAKGQYLLTGSVTPAKTAPRHSGAGRIARIRMSPMTLFESGNSSGAVSLAGLFKKKRIAPEAADIALEDLVFLAARGGWPASRNDYSRSALELPRQYIDAVIGNEFFTRSDARRNPAKLRRLLRSLARNNATFMNESTVYADISDSAENQGKEQLSRQSIATYLRDLMRIFVIEEIPGWTPALRSKTRIRMSPKRIFADPSLAAAALGASPEKLLEDLNTFGFLFEGLCQRDLLVYANLLDGSLFHYRDNTGLEVDAIVELPGGAYGAGAYGAFEIKLGAWRVDEAAASLLRFRKKMTDADFPAPAFLAVLCGGGTAHTREDGIHVVPVNSLGP